MCIVVTLHRFQLLSNPGTSRFVGRSYGGEQAFQRLRYAIEVQRIRQERRIAKLSQRLHTQPAPKLRFTALVLPRVLSLKRLEGPQFILRRDDVQNGIDANGTDKFVFQIGIADVEPERFHFRSRQVHLETRAFERTLETMLLSAGLALESPASRSFMLPIAFANARVPV